MFLDSAQFPLVWMHNKPSAKQNPQAAFAELDQLLARRQAFVLLGDEGFDEGEHGQTREDRKRISLWMKKHKTEIRAFIKGMVQVEPSATKRAAARAFATLYAKFWGYPLLMSASKEEALKVADELLGGQPR
jgi:hypothetical protein